MIPNLCYTNDNKKRRDYMRLKDKKVIALVEEDFEDLELWYPILRLQEEGA